MTLVAVAAIGLTAGACSLGTPGGAGSYSAIQPDLAGPAATAAIPTVSTATNGDFVEVPVQGAMPGDLKRSAADGAGRGVEPVAALSASARERSRWETLRPGDLTRVPVAGQQAAAPAGAGMSTGAALMAPAAGTGNRKAPKTEANSYDREAAMQGLIDGGRSAGKGICSGC